MTSPSRQYLLKLGLDNPTKEEVNMKKILHPVHPGKILFEDFMKPLGLSMYRVAKDIAVPTLRISQIVHGQ